MDIAASNLLGHSELGEGNIFGKHAKFARLQVLP